MSAVDVALLRALRAAPAHCELDVLATEAGVPVAQVRQRIDELRAAGFSVEEQPGRGFRLLAAPDRLIADDLLARLGRSALIRDILIFEETDSTNERAAHLGRAGVEPGVAVFAERQTAGRGRFARRWESASHLGLWFSLLLRPVVPPAQWPRLTTWAAVSVAAAVGGIPGVRATIKWPNDIFVDGLKVAGILTETGTDCSQQPFAVVGIGVNVNHLESDFPPELHGKATSLRGAGPALDRAAVAVSILQALETRYARVAGDFAELVDEATRRSFLLDRWIQVRTGSTVVSGVAEGLDGEGCLLLRELCGTLRQLSGGEVSVLAM